MKKRPKLPMSVATSMAVGVYITQLEGRVAPVQRGHDDHEALEPHAHVDQYRDREQQGTLPRTRRHHRSCGTTTLHRTMVQKAHA